MSPLPPPTRRRKPAVLLAGAALLLCAMGFLLAVLVVTTGQRLLLRHDLGSFAETPGIVLHARTRSIGQGRAIPEIRFEYTVGAAQYENTNRGTTDALASSEAEKVLSGLTKGSRITVYYDLEDPQRSVVAKEIPIFTRLTTTLLTALGALAMVSLPLLRRLRA